MKLQELFDVSETSLWLIIFALIIVVSSTTYVAAVPDFKPSSGLSDGEVRNAVVNSDLGIGDIVRDNQGGIYIDFDTDVRLATDKNFVLGSGGKIIDNSSTGRILIQDLDGITLDGDVALDGTHSLDVSGSSQISNSTWSRVRVAGDIDVAGDLETSSTGKIGSYFMIEDDVYANGTPRILSGLKYGDTIDCPANTRIVSCNGWIEEGYGCPPGEERGLGCNVSHRELGPTEKYGTAIDVTANSCTSYYGNTYLDPIGSGRAAYHNIQAVCFDPTGSNTGVINVTAY